MSDTESAVRDPGGGPDPAADDEPIVWPDPTGESHLATRLKLMDGIVGRCIRDLDYGERVLEDPDGTLAEYDLEEGELDDFRALARYKDEALPRWRELHAFFYGSGTG